MNLFDDKNFAVDAAEFVAKEEEKKASLIMIAGAMAMLLTKEIGVTPDGASREEKKEASLKAAAKYAEIFEEMLGSGGYIIVKQDV